MTDNPSSALHESGSDRYLHVTIAVATQEMKEQGVFYKLHSRIKSLDEEVFAGSETFEKGTKTVNREMKKAYEKPIRVHSSLISDDLETTIVGCAIVDEAERWYVVDSERVVFLEEDRFFSAGYGSDEHLRF